MYYKEAKAPSQFDKDTLIHLVIPASQWDAMWKLWRENHNDDAE